MFGTFGRREETDREAYLARELEREQRERQESDDRASRADEKRRNERQEESRARHESWMRSASNWPEALEKQAGLCRREVSMGLQQDKKFGLEPEPDEYFQQASAANEKALEIWNTVSLQRQAELEELQRQIDAVWESVRGEVADQLRALSEHLAYVGVAEAIRNDSLDGYLDW